MNESKVREVAAGIYVVHLPLPMKPTIVNVTLMRSGGEWALVDTGVNTEDSLAALLAAMEHVGCPVGKLSKLIATHHHPDHFGASRRLKELTGAPVYMHALEYEASTHYAPQEHSDEAIRFFLQNGIPLQRFARVPSAGEFWSQLYAPVQPDHLISDGEVLRLGDLEIEIVATPGHTPGHCVLYLRRQKIMIAGDHLLPKITPHVGFFPGGPENPLADFLESQQKIQRYDVEMVLPAHGGTFADHRYRARQIAQHHDYRLREMLDVVRRAPHTAYDVARQAFGFDIDGPLQVQFPATFETLAHLEYMRQQGTIVREEREEKLYYRAA
ncbi:MAG: MBL fold metallo-hydrolase [Deltaproteobacteria bacterium]|nr:MBL fold metallo-hydrolase [Deltaproteobacteria bacterium]